ESLVAQTSREMAADESAGAQNQRRALVRSWFRRFVAGCRPLGFSVSGAQPRTVPFMVCRVEQKGINQASEAEAFRSSKSGPSLASLGKRKGPMARPVSELLQGNGRRLSEGQLRQLQWIVPRPWTAEVIAQLSTLPMAGARVR